MQEKAASQSQILRDFLFNQHFFTRCGVSEAGREEGGGGSEKGRDGWREYFWSQSLHRNLGLIL